MSDIILGTCGLLDVPQPGGQALTRAQRIEKVNAALIERAERIMENQASAYSLFQTAIILQEQVHKRTEELLAAKCRLEKSNRDMLEAKEAAEVANRSKSTFLAAAGHDLLQPLNAARLLVSLLAEHSLAPGGLKLVEQVDRALASIEDLIKSVLDISKLEAGVMVPNVDVVPMRELLAAVAGEFAPVASQKGLRLSVKSPDVMVQSDPMLLKRILSNLASNAVRYTASGGILLGARRRGEQLRIDVVDTGIGIPPDQNEAIFREFHRGPAVCGDAAFGSGLGLGLAIVRRMTDALGHTLTFRSVEGRGSIFSLAVPITTREGTVADVTGLAAPSAYRLRGARILLVENDQPVVEAMSALMERWHCSMRFARDVASSVALAGDQHFAPDLLVVDYHLDNGLCGLDVVDAVRAATGRPVPTIITTADHSPEVEARVGARGFLLLRKPLKPAELRALITHCLS